MTNLIKENVQNNMQIHIDKAYKLIDTYLPYEYVKLVKEKLPGTNVSSQQIRNVRNRINTSVERRLDIITALVEVANDNRSAVNKLKKVISK